MTNISWGTKIAILYSSFVLLIVTMVIMCINQKVDLVSEDYYDKEVAYQSKINEMNNTKSLQGKVNVGITSNGIEITFPSEFKGKIIKGSILFFRPSDKEKDFTVQIKTDVNGLQNVPLKKLSKGMYKMQLDWEVDKVSYFMETVAVIP